MAGEVSVSALSEAQQARAEALRVAREVLRTGGGPMTVGGIGDQGPVELCDVAEYVISGSHPLAAYRPTEDDD